MKVKKKDMDYMKIQNKWQLIGYLFKYHWFKIFMAVGLGIILFKIIGAKNLMSILTLLGLY